MQSHCPQGEYEIARPDPNRDRMVAARTHDRFIAQSSPQEHMPLHTLTRQQTLARGRTCWADDGGQGHQSPAPGPLFDPPPGGRTNESKPATSHRTSPHCRRPERHLLIIFAASTLLSLLTTTGCGRQAGGLLYFLGYGRGQKIPAQYELPKGKVLVLVDDVEGLAQLPQTRELLVQYVGEELLAHKAAKQVVSPQAVNRLRQADPDFERRSAHQIGQKVEADVVLWLQVKDFFAPVEVEDTSAAARMSISVIVLDATVSDDPSKVRLWPPGTEGHLESLELTSNQVNALKGHDAVARKLAEKLSRQISRLFYKHTVGEVEDDRD